jgi:hypothetical protein
MRALTRGEPSLSPVRFSTGVYFPLFQSKQEGSKTTNQSLASERLVYKYRQQRGCGPLPRSLDPTKPTLSYLLINVACFYPFLKVTATMDVEKLHVVLQQSFSADANLRVPAEETVRNLKHSKGATTLLLQVASEKQVSVRAVRSPEF